MSLQSELIDSKVISNTDLPSLTLAKQIKLEYPTLFDSVEQIRSMIRGRRGNNGDRKRGQKILIAPKPNHFVPTKPKKEIPNDIHFDDPHLWLIISDAHIPFHDEKAFEIAVNYGKELGCDAVYCNGDFADNTAFSKWYKDPKHLTPQEDIRAFKENMKNIADLFPKKVFKVGNHDERYDKYLATHAEHLRVLDGTDFLSVMRLAEMGYECVESMQLAFLSSMPILHGHELERGFANPVNPARGVFMKTYDSMAVGHYHKTSSHFERMALHNKLIAARSIGCLCSLRTSYQALTKWNWGFATVKVTDSKIYEFSNYVIDDNYNVSRA